MSARVRTAGPWAYRPREFDDWGYIRGPEGWVVAIAKSGEVLSPRDANKHWEAKTDPYRANGEFIVLACNSHDQLVAALAGLVAAVESNPLLPQEDGELPALDAARAALATTPDR